VLRLSARSARRISWTVRGLYLAERIALLILGACLWFAVLLWTGPVTVSVSYQPPPSSDP
jgi:hypothetical protein